MNYIKCSTILFGGSLYILGWVLERTYSGYPEIYSLMHRIRKALSDILNQTLSGVFHIVRANDK